MEDTYHCHFQYGKFAIFRTVKLKNEKVKRKIQ